MEYYLLVIIFIITGIGCQDVLAKDNVEIYKIWAFNENPTSGALYIDPSSPSIYIGLVNHDSYQHNVKIKAEYEDETWESPIIPLSPNSHKENIVEIKLKFKEVGPHNVDISLIEDGETINSKTITVNVVNPIDVKSITCEDSYIDNNNPNVEVCNSQWFRVTLESNPYSQTDYEVKTWIAVVSKNYNKDASENENDDGVLYYGENDSKTIYLPLHGEAEVSFKIPPIVYDDDSVKIQVHTLVMGLHDYTDGEEKTERKIDNDGKIYYDYKKSDKEFLFPVSLMDYTVVNEINENNSYIVREFYDSSGIEDDEIEKVLKSRAISQYKNKKLLPRVYLTNDSYLVVLKLKLKNRFDQDVNANILIKDPTGSQRLIKVKLDRFEVKEIYTPSYIGYSGPKDIGFVVYTDDKIFTYNKTESIDVTPEEIPPVIISEIKYPNDDSITLLTNNSGNVLVGKNYTMEVTLKNNYNKTLSGYILVEDDFKEEVAEYPTEIYFEVRAHGKETYSIPMKFNREVNGDIKITVKTDYALADSIRTVHFNAYSILNIKKVYYNNTLKPKIATVNKDSHLFVDYPVAGFNNTCVVVLENPLNKKVRYKTWIEVVDHNGSLRAKSSEKIVEVPPRSINDGITTVDFKIEFKEGFEGYTVFFAVPIVDEFKDIEIIYTEGTGTISKEISDYYKIGRYSAIDLLSKVPTSINKVTKVIAPLNIDNLSYDENQIHAHISSELASNYPVNISYEYWVEMEKNGSTVYRSKYYRGTLHSLETNLVNIPVNDLDNGNYTANLYTKIPDFVYDNGKYHPMILKKSINLTLEKKESHMETENNKNTEFNAEEQNPDINKLAENSTENSQSSKQPEESREQGFLGNVFSSVVNSIKGLISMITNTALNNN